MKEMANRIPNELFSYELEQRQWTNRELADKILELDEKVDIAFRKEQALTDEDRVKRWRRGVAIPQKYFRQKLMEIFGKTMKQLGWADDNEIPNWKLDYSPNPLFTGREDILQWLHNGLAVRGTNVSLSVQALTGLSGIGKSHIAIEYAHRFKHEYHTIMWLRADNKEVLAADFAAISSHINLPEKEEKDQNKQIDAVLAWLKHKEITRWLLIFDHADSPEIIKEILRRYIPSPCHGHVIVTTRSSATGLIEQRKEVDRLSGEEGVRFLFRRTKLPRTDANNDFANMIVEELGGFPLALEQAGAYIEEKGCGLERYLGFYQSAVRKKLLAFKGDFTAYPHDPVAITLSIAFEQVRQANPIAIDLLSLFAFLAPDSIPEEVVSKGASVLSPALQQIIEQPDMLDDAMGELYKYSLIRRNPAAQTCTIHRLVQICIKDIMSLEVQQLWVEYAIEAISQTTPDLNNVTWLDFARFFSHTQVCVDYIEQWNLATSAAIHVLKITGIYLRERAEYGIAEQLLQKAKQRLETKFGLHHLEVAQCLSELGVLYRAVGNSPLSEKMHLQALTIREQILGLKHQTVCESTNSLALCYTDQGRYEEAEQLYKRSIDIYNHALESNHPDKIRILNNLALMYLYLGRYNEAVPIFERIIQLIEYNKLQEHHSSSIAYNNLAGLYSFQGKYAQAEEIYLRIIPLGERTLGKMHPTVGTWCNNLGRVYYLMNDPTKYAEAEELLNRAIVIHETALGRKHSLVGVDLNNLGYLYFIQGKYEQSQVCHQESLVIRREVLGDDHQHTAQSRRHLARLCKIKDQLLEAQQLYQQALDVWDKVLGTENTDVVRCRREYIEVLEALQENDKVNEQKKLLPATETD